MKKLLSLLLFILIISCKQSNNSEASYSTNELIFVVEMNSNKGKSSEEIKEFSQYYTDAIEKNEPNSLGWGFYEYGDKIILIERYKNEDANIITAKNISPNGNRYKLLQESFDFYTLKKVTVTGAYTQKLVDFNKVTAEKVGFTVPFEYYPLISGYSKNEK